jgi:hypothetical protein
LTTRPVRTRVCYCRVLEVLHDPSVLYLHLQSTERSLTFICHTRLDRFCESTYTQSPHGFKPSQSSNGRRVTSFAYIEATIELCSQQRRSLHHPRFTPSFRLHFCPRFIRAVGNDVLHTLHLDDLSTSMCISGSAGTAAPTERIASVIGCSWHPTIHCSPSSGVLLILAAFGYECLTDII